MRSHSVASLRACWAWRRNPRPGTPALRLNRRGNGVSVAPVSFTAGMFRRSPLRDAEVQASSMARNAGSLAAIR